MGPPFLSSPFDRLSDELVYRIISPECVPNEAEPIIPSEEPIPFDSDDAEDSEEGGGPSEGPEGGNTAAKGPRDRSALPLVCRQWRRAVQQNRTSLKFDGDPRGSVLGEWLRQHPKISHVSFIVHRKDDGDSIVRILKRSAPNLTALTLLLTPDPAYPPGSQIPEDIASFTGLRDLGIITMFNLRISNPLPDSLTRLTALTSFRGSSYLDPIPALPLKALRLTYSPVQESLSKFSALERLSLHKCSFGTTTSSLAALSRLTRLELVTNSEYGWDVGGTITCQRTLKELVIKPDTAPGPGMSRVGWGVPLNILSCFNLRSLDIALTYRDAYRGETEISDKLKEAAFLGSLLHLDTLTLWLEPMEPMREEDPVLQCEEVLQALGRSKMALRALRLTNYLNIPSTDEFWAQFFNLRRLELDRCGNPPPSLGSLSKFEIVVRESIHSRNFLDRSF